jgi:predicted 2-oxoglutarate/Fe(II)-dependent dioxygenase YbiX
MTTAITPDPDNDDRAWLADFDAMLPADRLLAVEWIRESQRIARKCVLEDHDHKIVQLTRAMDDSQRLMRRMTGLYDHPEAS